LFEINGDLAEECGPHANELRSAQMIGASVIPAIGVLAGVVGLVLIAGRLATRLPFRPQIGAGRTLVLRESVALDPRRRVHLLQCGQRQVVLLTGGSQDVVVGWMKET